jgi:hypothetical protein
MTENDSHQPLLRHPQAGALALNRPSSLVHRGLAALATLDRTLRFPDHRQVGWLHFDGRRVAARGEVRVPRASRVELQASIEGGRDLTFLRELGAEDLQGLDLRAAYYLRDEDLASLEALRGLTALNLAGCWSLTDAGLAQLAALEQLTALNLTWCRKLTDAGLAHLRPLQGLVEVSLPDSITFDARAAFYAPG